MLVVAGETIVDMIGRMDDPNVFDAHLGGGPFNVAIAAAKMGTKTGYLSPLSQDNFGDQFVKKMHQIGVAPLSSRSPKPSGLAIVKTDANGHPSYTFHREDAADRDIDPKALDSDFPKDAEMFYIGGLALADGADARIWQGFTSHIDKPVFCDPNIRPSFIRDREEFLARLDLIYDACDILKLSDEDIDWLEPNTDTEAYVRDVMAKHNIAIGFLTSGGDGAAVYFEGHSQSRKAPEIKVVDTVGAGDCFSAAIISSVLRTGGFEAQSASSLASALEYAITAAAINCERAGANAPTHQEILDYKQTK